MLTGNDWQALWLSVQLAGLTTAILLLICTPLAWGLSRWRSRFAIAIEIIATLPLVLPPTVLGFYLLICLGANGPLGQFFDLSLAFSFTGLVIGSIIYSLPFVLQPLLQAFRGIDHQLLVAATLTCRAMGSFSFCRLATDEARLCWRRRSRHCAHPRRIWRRPNDRRHSR